MGGKQKEGRGKRGEGGGREGGREGEGRGRKGRTEDISIWKLQSTDGNPDATGVSVSLPVSGRGQVCKVRWSKPHTRGVRPTQPCFLRQHTPTAGQSTTVWAVRSQVSLQAGEEDTATGPNISSSEESMCPQVAPPSLCQHQDSKGTAVPCPRGAWKGHLPDSCVPCQEPTRRCVTKMQVSLERL